MPAAGTYRPSIPSLPVDVPQKTPYQPSTAPSHSPYSRAAASPPSAGSSVATSAVPSLTNGETGTRDGHDHSSSGANSVDLMEMLNDRVSAAVNPIPMDRSIARQAQQSGELNAKQRELAELQAMAARRLKSARANMADGMKAAKEVRKDLEWTQKRVNSLNAKAASKYPAAYKQASAKYPSPADY